MPLAAPPPTAHVASPLRVSFGYPRAQARQAILGVALPQLAGADHEVLPPAAVPVATAGATVCRGDGLMSGFVLAADGEDLEAATLALYERIFALTQGHALYRIWNYVPHINAAEAGLENYQRFCRARSLAFERRFGRGFQRELPAASAVGSEAGPLAVAFVAGARPSRHFENPQQVPAYCYPPQYGPRSPSFSRATVVGEDSGRQVYISGTAAIRGHATVAAGDFAGQLACTLDNLQTIAATTGVNLANPTLSRSFKIYLRRASDLPAARTRIETAFGQAATASYLRADLCRSDLLVEIEAAVAPSNQAAK